VFFSFQYRGGGGIRTLGGDYLPTTVFKTVAFNRSATPPFSEGVETAGIVIAG
jgi:hypothetical protein